jgi:hypothetical protein
MKQTGLLLFISLLCYNLTAQVSDPEIQFPGQNIKNSIKYTFPEPVNCIVQEYMLRDTNCVYFILLEENTSFIELVIINIHQDDFQFAKAAYAYVSSTNRYCVANNKALPIVFFLEMAYSLNYLPIEGEAFLIRLKRLSPGNFIYAGSKTINLI